MNALLIEKNNYVENSISTLRKQEEQIYSVIDKKYNTLTSLLTFEKIDYISELLGDYVGNFAVEKIYDKQNFNPKYGKFKNFFTRNVYIDPIKKKNMEGQRKETYIIARTATDFLLKMGSRRIIKAKIEKGKYDIYREVYSLLYMYAYDDNNINDKMALKVELKKILTCFDLEDKSKKKLLNEVEVINIKQLAMLDGNFISNTNDEIALNVAYLLYLLANSKYDDESKIEKSLLSYYDYLGFHGNNVKEILKENEHIYNSIERDQHRMISISRQMVGQLFMDIPEYEINIEDIIARGNEMAKYDPYSLRRHKIQSRLQEGAQAVKKITIQQITRKYPELSMLSASDALAQFNLSDNMKEHAEKKLLEWSGGERKLCDNIIKNADLISEEAKNSII